MERGGGGHVDRPGLCLVLAHEGQCRDEGRCRGVVGAQPCGFPYGRRGPEAPSVQALGLGGCGVVGGVLCVC